MSYSDYRALGRYAAPRAGKKKKKKKAKPYKKKKKKKKTGPKPKKKIERKRHKRKGDEHRKKWTKINYKQVMQLKALYLRDRNKYGTKAEFMEMLSDKFNVSWETIYKIVNGDTRWGEGALNVEERVFKEKVLRFLKSLGYTWYVKNDHRALRGIPDIIACVNGTFVAIELKANKKKLFSTSNKSTKLQMHELAKINGKARGVGFYAYPECWAEVKEKLKLIAKGDRDDINNCREYTKQRLYYWSSEVKRQYGFSPQTGLPFGTDSSEDRVTTDGSAEDVQQTGD